MKLRTIQTGDFQYVRELIIQSFEQSEHGYNDEASLVEMIRESPAYNQALEVVASIDKSIVGHGLLSEAVIKNDINAIDELKGLVLAPLSVLPSYQNKGIGTHLLLELEKRAIKTDYAFITILGEPAFYSRFGYVQSDTYHVSSELDVPTEYLLMKKLKPEMIEGTLFYNRAFG
ncbi:GNAT family N-acetyltransferase [Vagococcus sp. JNUCC 83]